MLFSFQEYLVVRSIDMSNFNLPKGMREPWRWGLTRITRNEFMRVKNSQNTQWFGNVLRLGSESDGFGRGLVEAACCPEKLDLHWDLGPPSNINDRAKLSDLGLLALVSMTKSLTSLECAATL